MAVPIITPHSPGHAGKRARKNRGASVRMEKPEHRRSYRPLLKPVLLLVVIGAVAGSAGNISEMVASVSNRKVEQIRIEGDMRYVSENDVREVVNNFIRESLVAVDMDRIKQSLELKPWIRTVEIRRQWPDTMILTLTEEKAIANWGESQLLNQDGEIFSPESTRGLETLPHLYGPDRSARKVMEQYQLLNQLLYPSGMRIVELGVNARGAWALELANGVGIRVGKDRVIEKIKRFVDFAGPALIEQMVDIESIDLRYANGIAIKPKQITGEEVVSL